MTIRAYNPKLKNVPFGEETNVKINDAICGIENVILCCYCLVTKYMVNSSMKEDVHFACDGKKTI